MTSDRNPPLRPFEDLWSVPLRIEEVPSTGAHIELTADERTRQGIAATAGLRTLPRLEAAFDVVRSGVDGLHVSGRVAATVGQTCVVTLEPVESEVVEPFDLVFKPAPAPVAGEHAEVGIAAGEVEPLVNGAIDLGAIATEFLLLGIDPYPRRPGAVFEPPSSGEPAGSAFAALAALKKKPPI
jgi:Large ribosomal RNA subunit accumulation protein YceD